MRVRIAITGGIAEGKSTVLELISELGHPVGSADEIAREVFDDPQVNRQIALLFGDAAEATREQVRAAIAVDPSVRRRLNTLTHPIIHARLSQSDATFVEVPLLIEACIYGLFDQVWVVTCGADEQRRRLLERYGDELQVDRLLGTQLVSRAKTPFSDRVIRTNTDPWLVRQIVASSVNELFGTATG